MALGISETTRNARADAVLAQIDGGTVAGKIKIYSAARPATGGSASPTAWAASTAYSVGDTAQPTTANGYYYRCTVAGTSGSTEPTWPTTSGTVADGGVTWEFVGEVPVLLATLTLNDPAAPAASGGVLTFDATNVEGTAVADGTAAWARITDSADTFVMDADVGVSGSGAEVIVSTTTIATNGQVTLQSATLTEGGA